MYKLVILSALLAVAAGAPKPGVAVVPSGAQYTATYNPAVLATVDSAPVVAAYTADVAAAPVAYASQVAASPYAYHTAPLGYNGYNAAYNTYAYQAAPVAYASSPLAYSSAYNYPLVYQQPAVASYSAYSFKPRSGENHGYAVTY